MPYLTDDDMKTISNILVHKAKCIDIANKIGCDLTIIADAGQPDLSSFV